MEEKEAEFARFTEPERQWGIEWKGRVYNPSDFSSSDSVNQALSAGHACLYGITHAVIAALGCSPGLGFVHVGNENSFVYDVADLYKAETTIPTAFEAAASNANDVGTAVRRLVRDRFVSGHVLERMVKDIHCLLMEGEDDTSLSNEVRLWNGASELLANGINYGEPLGEMETP